ncbi:MAG: c-type cytochrome [Gammaproteobacteria bacterium]
MKLRHIQMLAAVLFSITGNVSAQSIEDNIRPVGQVCLQGQSCVGSLVGAAAASPMAVTAPEAVAAAAEPTAAPSAAAVTATEPAFDAAAAYQMSCFACHGTGAAGAPMPGDAEAWSTRMEKGMDAVMANVTNGLNAMPVKGLCMNCSDGDLRALVDYMLAQ